MKNDSNKCCCDKIKTTKLINEEHIHNCFYLNSKHKDKVLLSILPGIQTIVNLLFSYQINSKFIWQKFSLVSKVIETQVVYFIKVKIG